MSTIFEQIIDGKIPCSKVYENEHLIAFKDIAPQAPIHLLIVPKKHFPNIQSVPSEELSLMSHVAKAAQELAVEFGIEEGYRLITNNGSNAGQTVFHLHFHLIGGDKLSNDLA